MKYIILFVFCLSLTSTTGCEGKYAEAGAVLAMAGVLTIIQSARGKASPRSACNIYCDGCTFPCGNRCVPYGTLCYDPPGKACKGKSGQQVCEKWNSGDGKEFREYSHDYYIPIPVN